MKKSNYIKFGGGAFAFILMNSIILSAFCQNAVPKNLSETNKVIDPAFVTITLGSISEAKPINTLFSGISMETEAVRPSENGSYYFSAKNTKLAALFRQLGVKHLRIGGNTVDDLTKTPTLADIDQFFAFAKLAKVKVTYSVRLKNGDPKESAKIAKHIYSKYKDIITGITIGNETDQYYKDKESEYLADAKLHFKAMREAAPDVRINGPGIHLNAPWLLSYAEAFKTEMKIDYIGAHAYFGGNAYGNTMPPLDRDPGPLWKEMLSPEWQEKYTKFYNAFGPELHKLNIPFRIDETNTYYMGGAPGASNSMAASIWTLDYLYWWAEHGADGINFHTGTTLPYNKGRIPNGATRKPGFYAVYWDLPNNEYATQAVGYGMKAFDLGSHGKLFPVEVTTEDKAQVSAHAVLADDGSVYLTILNKEIGTAPRAVVLKQLRKMGFTKVESISLGVKNNYAGAIEGFTVGGAKIETDGFWKGKWKKVSSSGDTISVVIPPTSAVILHLSKK
jgi:hypothetical protein